MQFICYGYTTLYGEAAVLHIYVYGMDVIGLYVQPYFLNRLLTLFLYIYSATRIAIEGLVQICFSFHMRNEKFIRNRETY